MNEQRIDEQHMNEHDWLEKRFAEQRTRLKAVAYRMLGSTSEADDAVQSAWLRISRADTGAVDNVGAWLTTVVARISLNMLRSRARRREDPLEVHVPDPIISRDDRTDPEVQALLADSVGLALQVVLDTLGPDERLAFVLHDLFAVPYDEIGPMIDRTPTAARQLASRARRRVRGGAIDPNPDVVVQREVVDAFFAATRDGDFAALLQVLDPDVVLRADGGRSHAHPTVLLRGARQVASNAGVGRRLAEFVRPALINGTAGAVIVTPSGRALSVMAFTVTGRRIAAIDVLYDPDRLDDLDLTVLDTQALHD